MARFGQEKVAGADLAHMWRNGAFFLPHLAGCGCAGPHVSLDRDSIEADLIAYLVQTYRDAGRSALIRFVAARESDDGARTAFATWLAAIDTAPLNECDRRRLAVDLESALASLEAANLASRFVCE